MFCTFAPLSPEEMNALHVLGESTAGASRFGCADACCVIFYHFSPSSAVI
jgi:hypothetical protein